MKTKIVSCHTAASKPVKQEVNGTVILPPLVFPGLTFLPGIFCLQPFRSPWIKVSNKKLKRANLKSLALELFCRRCGEKMTPWTNLSQQDETWAEF